MMTTTNQNLSRQIRIAQAEVKKSFDKTPLDLQTTNIELNIITSFRRTEELFIEWKNPSQMDLEVEQ